MPSLSPRRLLAAALLALCAPLALVLPAAAHGFTSVAYVELTEPADGLVRAELELEYVLLVSSVAQAEGDPELEAQAKGSFRSSGADAALLDQHAETVLRYLGDRFRIAADGRPCQPATDATFESSQRDGVPHAVVGWDFTCSPGAGVEAHEVSSELFPEGEGFVGSTDTIVEFDLAGRTGNTVLTADDPSFSTDESSSGRLVEFFVLGAEHLLFGLDHVLFLVALIIGSRRPRDVLSAATAFTAAHSVTFILASLGILAVPAAIVEPVIALSIAAVAGWHVWTAVLDRLDPRAAPSDGARELPGSGGVSGGGAVATLTRPETVTVAASARRIAPADRARLVVVFAFGLLHGMGFAGALGIDEPFSWGLLGSLLVFNLGIEVVQLAIIAAVFPLLLVLRRRRPALGLWLGVGVAAAVTAIGCFWFFQRVLGTG